MKKLIFLFLLVSPNMLWAGGCSEVSPPSLTDLNWILDEQYTYEDERLGSSISYEKEGNSLTYYTYDFGLDAIDSAILEEQLISSLSEIYDMLAQYPELTSSDPMSMGEYAVSNMIDANDYVRRAYMIESSLGDLRFMDAVTLGTDGSCIFKIRYTAELEYPTANPLVDGMDIFTELSHEFFSRLDE